MVLVVSALGLVMLPLSTAVAAPAANKVWFAAVKVCGQETSTKPLHDSMSFIIAPPAEHAGLHGSCAVWAATKTPLSEVDNAERKGRGGGICVFLCE